MSNMWTCKYHSKHLPSLYPQNFHWNCNNTTSTLNLPHKQIQSPNLSSPLVKLQMRPCFSSSSRLRPEWLDGLMVEPMFDLKWLEPMFGLKCYYHFNTILEKIPHAKIIHFGIRITNLKELESQELPNSWHQYTADMSPKKRTIWRGTSSSKHHFSDGYVSVWRE